jgi:hypothetical protein
VNDHAVGLNKRVLDGIPLNMIIGPNVNVTFFLVPWIEQLFPTGEPPTKSE